MRAWADNRLSSARSISASALTRRSSAACSTVPPLPKAAGQFCSLTYTRVNERQLVTRYGSSMLFAAFLLAAAFAGGTASASALTGDPRVCGDVTPGGPAHHAYWCAKTAATDALRAKMAARTHVARWFYPTSCDQAGTLLRWRCTTLDGGNIWHATVTFARTSAGWRRVVTVTP